MVSPDNKIEPNRDVSSKEKEQVRRKPPVKEFKEPIDQIDERRYLGEDEQDSIKGPKKKNFMTKLFDQNPDEDQTSMVNLFELASRRNTTDEEDESEEKEAFIDSIFENQKSKKPFEMLTGGDQKPAIAFEQPDLSQVNPAATAQVHLSIEKSAAMEVAKASDIKSLQQIIDQIVKEVYTHELNGQSETVISLRGHLEGSRLIIQQSDSAKGQLNILIDNLTAASQKLLETHKDMLLSQLAEKNILVQIFIASTAHEPTKIELAAGDQEKKDFLKRENRGGDSSKEQTRK